MDGWRTHRRGVSCPGASPVAGSGQPAVGSVTEQRCAARQRGVRPQDLLVRIMEVGGGLFWAGVTWRGRLRVERNSRLCGREI